MSNDILHQVGRIVTESDPSTFLGKFFTGIGAAVTWFCIWLGTVHGSFIRVFDPATWTLQDYASFASLLAAIMYFIKNFSDWRYAKRREKRELALLSDDKLTPKD
jgi:hypothetical protein